jgi:organic radical activating enzyme
MTPLVRIEHQDPRKGQILFVDWFLGNLCNYSCSYCPSTLHDGSIAWSPYEHVVGFGEHLARRCKALGKTAFVQFTGGEITLYRDLRKVAEHLHGIGCRIGLISNGSRGLDTWRALREVTDMVVLTYHVEFSPLPRFIEVARLMSERVRTHVNVAMHPDRFQECAQAASAISESCTNITLTLKPLLVDFGEELYDYTAEQRTTMADPQHRPKLTRPLSGIRGDMRCHFADGTEQVLSATQLLVQGLNRWSGWICNAGLEILSVDAQGYVYRGVCGEGGAVAHISDAVPALPSQPVRCTRVTCHCLSDIMTSRRVSAET